LKRSPNPALFGQTTHSPTTK